jgi:hypothetical protein
MAPFRSATLVEEFDSAALRAVLASAAFQAEEVRRRQSVVQQYDAWTPTKAFKGPMTKGLMQYLELGGKEAIGRVSVTYKIPAARLGRLVPKSPAGAANYCFGMNRAVRSHLAHGLYHDVDMVNAAPSLALQLMRRDCLRADRLAEYVANRKPCIADVASCCGVDEGRAKELFLRLSFGGTIAAWQNANHVPNRKMTPFVRALAKELRANMVAILKLHPEYMQQQQKKKGKDAWNLEGSAFSIMYQDTERQCLSALYDAVVSDGRAVGALIHDGLFVRRSSGDDTSVTLSSDTLDRWSSAIKQQTGFDVQVVEKVMKPEAAYVHPAVNELPLTEVVTPPTTTVSEAQGAGAAGATVAEDKSLSGLCLRALASHGVTRVQDVVSAGDGSYTFTADMDGSAGSRFRLENMENGWTGFSNLSQPCSAAKPLGITMLSGLTSDIKDDVVAGLAGLVKPGIDVSHVRVDDACLAQRPSPDDPKSADGGVLRFLLSFPLADGDRGTTCVDVCLTTAQVTADGTPCGSIARVPLLVRQEVSDMHAQMRRGQAWTARYSDESRSPTLDTAGPPAMRVHLLNHGNPSSAAVQSGNLVLLDADNKTYSIPAGRKLDIGKRCYDASIARGWVDGSFGAFSRLFLQQNIVHVTGDLVQVCGNLVVAKAGEATEARIPDSELAALVLAARPDLHERMCYSPDPKEDQCKGLFYCDPDTNIWSQEDNLFFEELLEKHFTSDPALTGKLTQRDMAHVLSRRGRSDILRIVAGKLRRKGFEDKLNSNLDLFAFRNGVWDTRKREFRPIVPRDLISLTTGWDYVAEDAQGSGEARHPGTAAVTDLPSPRGAGRGLPLRGQLAVGPPHNPRLPFAAGFTRRRERQECILQAAAQVFRTARLQEHGVRVPGSDRQGPQPTQRRREEHAGEATAGGGRAHQDHEAGRLAAQGYDRRHRLARFRPRHPRQGRLQLRLAGRLHPALQPGAGACVRRRRRRADRAHGHRTHARKVRQPCRPAS